MDKLGQRGYKAKEAYEGSRVGVYDSTVMSEEDTVKERFMSELIVENHKCMSSPVFINSYVRPTTHFQISIPFQPLTPDDSLVNPPCFYYKYHLIVLALGTMS